ncbi:hypothetical protein M440DRAFT_1227998 [Trichoderma longibrachiatum ATCC 18648]|uniref:Uncharacterized protein n=1 Tax=Trichoderma longibrachiatum ATCC 18648 TaxID=983965 RepID=A0A2T4C8R2_TRILO|nr:hypothetical protein M440DRAFT_1227998 [Trichoderma longibrachiatum ATCC 18648]
MAPSCTQTAKGSRRSPCRAKASTGWVPASIPPLDSRTMDASCLFCPSSLIRHAGSRLGSPCSSPRSDPFRPACLISDPWPRRDKGTKEKRAVLRATGPTGSFSRRGVTAWLAISAAQCSQTTARQRHDTTRHETAAGDSTAAACAQLSLVCRLHRSRAPPQTVCRVGSRPSAHWSHRPSSPFLALHPPWPL